MHFYAAGLLPKKSVRHSATKILALIEKCSLNIANFYFASPKIIVYAERHSFKLLMVVENGSEVSTNLLDSA